MQQIRAQHLQGADVPATQSQGRFGCEVRIAADQCPVQVGVSDPPRGVQGARDFLNWLKSEFQVIILSDTFYQFAGPLMAQLDYPTLFCNSLVVAEDGRIEDYTLRQPDGKTKAVKALQSLNFQVIASGDSYNDTGMLVQAEGGIFFKPPESITQEFPQFPVTHNYDELKNAFIEVRAKVRG